MNAIGIDLTERLERVLSEALALPDDDTASSISEEEVERAVRSLYAAAHGRAVETPIGRIPIAPAIAGALLRTPLSFQSRGDLIALVQAQASSDGNGSVMAMPWGEQLKESAKKPAAERNANVRARFGASSALREFVAGRLGAPDFWPNENSAPCISARVRDEARRAIERWETEGGRTGRSLHAAKSGSQSRNHFQKISEQKIPTNDGPNQI